MRWCIVVIHNHTSHEQRDFDTSTDLNAAKGLRSHLEAVEVIHCQCSSGMGVWLRSVGSRAVLVRYRSIYPLLFRCSMLCIFVLCLPAPRDQLAPSIQVISLTKRLQARPCRLRPV